MTSYINQTIARQQIAELVAEAERGRVRRQFRQARREARVRRRGAGQSTSNSLSRWPQMIGYAGAS